MLIQKVDSGGLPLFNLCLLVFPRNAGKCRSRRTVEIYVKESLRIVSRNGGLPQLVGSPSLSLQGDALCCKGNKIAREFCRPALARRGYDISSGPTRTQRAPATPWAGNDERSTPDRRVGMLPGPDRLPPRSSRNRSAPNSST
jgi:hypothetical protein